MIHAFPKSEFQPGAQGPNYLLRGISITQGKGIRGRKVNIKGKGLLDGGIGVLSPAGLFFSLVG